MVITDRLMEITYCVGEYSKECKECDDKLTCKYSSVRGMKKMLETNDNDGGMTCDWCNMTYPLGGWDYYQIRVFNILHTICSDCYKHLNHITIEKQLEHKVKR